MIENGMRPVHPGEVLREDYLLPLGLSAHALSKALKVPAPRINDIVRERRGISADTALRLARYFDSSPQFWLNLQAAYDLPHAQMAAGKTIEREVPVRHLAARSTPLHEPQGPVILTSKQLISSTQIETSSHMATLSRRSAQAA